MSLKNQFIQFVSEIEDVEGIVHNLYTIEQPAFLEGQLMKRQWLFPKQEIIDLITNNFDDDLNGQFNDQDNTQTKIEEWGLLDEANE